MEELVFIREFEYFQHWRVMPLDLRVFGEFKAANGIKVPISLCVQMRNPGDQREGSTGFSGNLLLHARIRATPLVSYRVSVKTVMRVACWNGCGFLSKNRLGEASAKARSLVNRRKDMKHGKKWRHSEQRYACER